MGRGQGLAGRTPQEMTLRVAFRRAARGDFEDAALWYEERRLGLGAQFRAEVDAAVLLDRKSTRLNSSHSQISYAVFCLKKKHHRAPPGDLIDLQLTYE